MTTVPKSFRGLPRLASIQKVEFALGGSKVAVCKRWKRGLCAGLGPQLG